MVVVLLLLGAWAGGVFSSASTTSGPTTFAQAASLAENAASAEYGGSWVPLLGIGNNVHADYSLPVPTDPFSGANCSGTSSPEFRNMTIPGQSSTDTGASTGWAVLMRNSAASAIATALVVQGQPQLLGESQGPSCAPIYVELSAIPSNAIDSNAAVAAADAAGGSEFLSIHPDSNLTIAVFGGFAALPFPGLVGMWTLAFSDCPLDWPTSVAGSAFEAQVNLTSGAIITSQTIDGFCAPNQPTPSPPAPSLPGPPPPPSTPLGTALALGNVLAEKSGGTWFYNMTVAAAASGLVADDLEFEVINSAGSPVDATGSVDLVAVSGVTVAQFELSPAPGYWSSGASTEVISSQTLSMTITSPAVGLSGDTLEIVGVGPYEGTIAEGIP